MTKDKKDLASETPAEIVPETPPIPTETEPTLPPTVEIPVDKLQAVMDRLDNLEASNAALRETVSSTRLQEAEDKQGLDSRPRVHFKVLDGKVVIGWPEALGPEKKSEMIFNPSTNMPVGEILKSVYYFLDGTKSELMDQIRFTRENNQAYARVIQDDGDYGLLEFEDKSLSSEPVRIHKRFWNA